MGPLPQVLRRQLLQHPLVCHRELADDRAVPQRDGGHDSAESPTQGFQSLQQPGE